jgi:hypothetical protein
LKPASCEAPESELLQFLLAGTLSDAERAAVLAHVAGCPACTEELAASRVLVEALRDAHLTSEEVVAAAWDGGHDAHLAVCPRCRAEVDELRADVLRLQAGASGRAPSRPSRSFLAAAASIAVVITATILYRSQPSIGPFPPARPSPTGGAAPTPATTNTPAIPTPTPALRVRDVGQPSVALREIKTAFIDLSGDARGTDIAAVVGKELGGVLTIVDDPNNADAVVRGVVSSIGDARIRIDRLRLINAAGDVLWPSSQGGRYDGAPDDLARRIASEIRAARDHVRR